ncbi:energy transducer TonB family protein [Bosea sp. (in: a-proteobacteria)]|uniref:energy transducer TonB family protein n=1 Tax=Bosea sp. (in: a-proteobacteria) TaxID=1871050 RepID=UPI002FCC3BD3
MIAIAPQRRGLAALRWATAALAVASVHGGLAWVALHWRPAEAAAGAPEPAVMIELAAVSIAPEAPPEELPVAPEKVEPEVEPEPVKETPPEPEPPPPEPEPEPTPIEQPEIELPPLPPIPQLDAVLLPPPKPKEVEKKPPPKPKVVEKKQRPKRKVVERERPKAREAAAPEASTPRAAAPAATQGAAARPSVSTAAWRGMLIAHLNRHKRFPPGARPGTVQVAFAIDRGGRVLSARVTSSSGDPALDSEATSMIRRASPVPAPPDGVGGGGAISLSVPVRFNR